MLPLPFEDHITVLLKQNINDKGQAFVDKVDSLLVEIRDEILEMQYLKFIARMPAAFLNELGDYLAAGLKNLDSDSEKRKKISEAVLGHKSRGSWNDDAKLRINAITGYSAVLYTNTDPEDSIEMGGLDKEDDDVYWSTERGDDTMDTSLGTWELGFMTEYVVAGNVYINCHDGVTTPVLTQSQVDQIVLELDDDVVPAYFRAYIGYVDGSGGFVTYTGGVIG